MLTVRHDVRHVMNEATLSADIIKSTALSQENMRALRDHLLAFAEMIRKKFPGCWGRVVRGDGFECVVGDPRMALRMALLLRCHVKTFQVDKAEKKAKGQDVRISLGLGGLRANDASNGFIDGEAIYNSGRSLDAMSRGANFVVACADEDRRAVLQVIFGLLDGIFANATARQCKMMAMRLMDIPLDEVFKTVAKNLFYGQMRKMNWTGVRAALDFYEHHLDF